ncbi:hypothetical protein RCF27_09195 [Rhodococcus pyridinivorans]|uniref:hypothetical protein n=1 Tax=Rhodococcus pyridinivorans TaxID=103816 RepID=UPI00280C08F1|nr:hypothetical protein [Rhodococcus pyridinivorans]WMM74433.1 hypothetical protein RCF27_09195 [Rhodococcus pyridinivorans]
MSLNQSIIDAVEKSLPSMQVKAIHEALGELEELRAYKKTTNAHVKDLESSLSEKRQTITDLNLAVTELRAENDGLKTELEAAKEKAREANVTVLQSTLDAVERTTDKFLRNTVYREEAQRHIATTSTGSHMQYVNGQQQLVPFTSTNMHPVKDVKVTATDVEPESGQQGEA